ncbi:MAG: hypothetical protein KIT56_02140 [Gammaproteobacteria bacterium]|nr:hypothetical protein [Gammaproteobacteria bacterium]MCW5582681.1 hypothetical protein [Gammaproteobacteria bacterium]
MSKRDILISLIIDSCQYAIRNNSNWETGFDAVQRVALQSKKIERCIANPKDFISFIGVCDKAKLSICLMEDNESRVKFFTLIDDKTGATLYKYDRYKAIDDPSYVDSGRKHVGEKRKLSSNNNETSAVLAPKKRKIANNSAVNKTLITSSHSSTSSSSFLDQSQYLDFGVAVSSDEGLMIGDNFNNYYNTAGLFGVLNNGTSNAYFSSRKQSLTDDQPTQSFREISSVSNPQKR